MLKIFQYIALVSALAFLLALLGVAYYSSPQSNSLGVKEVATEQNATQQQKNQGEEGPSFWLWLFPDSLAVFTFWLALSTVALGIVAVIQIGYLNKADTTANLTAKAAQQSADVAQQALLSAQRAFVFPASFDNNFVPANNVMLVNVRWQNSGDTPTKGMTNYTSWKFFPGGLPPGYAFPDLDANGQPTTAPQTGTEMFIGPKASIGGQLWEIPFSMLQSAFNKQGRLFIWGRAEYNDVFPNTKRHITKFCNEIDVKSYRVTGQQTEITLGFPIFGVNCADDECK